jgi:glycosyltransferase involved in cell wall biosynthesis
LGADVRIVNVSGLDPQWNWLAKNFGARPELAWTHVSTQSARVPAWLPRRHTWQRLASAWTARRLLPPSDSLLVSHGPRMTMYAGLANRARPRRSPHLAYSFNYTDLPTGALHRVHRIAFRTVDRFVVFSTMERSLYAEYFDIDPQRIDMIHWAVQPPRLAPGEAPLVAGDYICAVGSQARDYRVLVEAMKRLPQVKLVIVATPASMAGLALPDNVEVRMQIPLKEATNIVAHSRFTVLPLRGSQVPCGHVTLVNAMHLGKAVIVTDSIGVADYVQDDVNGLLVPPHDAVQLAERIRQLVEAPALRERLAESGHRFASSHCVEDNVVAYFARVVGELEPAR